MDMQGTVSSHKSWYETDIVYTIDPVKTAAENNESGGHPTFLLASTSGAAENNVNQRITFKTVPTLIA